MSAEELNNTGAEEPMFAGLKKKSKKAKVNFDDFMSQDAPTTAADAATATIAESEEKIDAGEEGGAPADAPAADDGGDMFADLKKKSKKKKKEIPLDLEASTPGDATPTEDTTAEAGEMGDFGDLKKKKKSSKKKAAFDIEAFEKEIEGGENDYEGGADGDAADLDRELGDDVFGGNDNADVDDETSKLGHEAWVGTDRDYTYPELLTRFYALLHSHNPELAGDKKKFTLVPPQVNREGTKKTVFANIADICRRMRRQPKHLMEFLFAELGTSGSVDGSQRLMIKGRYTQKNMENVLKKYIVEYVMCKTCKSSDTILEKENRLYFIICEACGSKRSVSAIKTGFQAQIGRRKAQAT